jgi:hypothetical protein
VSMDVRRRRGEPRDVEGVVGSLTDSIRARKNGLREGEATHLHRPTA